MPSKNFKSGLYYFLLFALVFHTSVGFSQGLLSKLNTFDLLLKYRNSSLKPVYRVSVRVESDGIADKVYTSTTDSNQRLQFVFDKIYKVTVTSENFMPVNITVDTRFDAKKGKIKINKDKTGYVKLFFSLDLVVPMCVLQRSAPADTSQKPAVRIYFDPKQNNFTLDSSYVLNEKNAGSADPCGIFLKEKSADPRALKGNFVDYNAKLVFGQQKSFLVDQGLNLKDSKGDVIQSTKTDVYGDFSFKKLDPSADFDIVLDKNLKVPPGESVYLTDSKGTATTELFKDENNDFVYDLLSSELLKLTENPGEGNLDKIEKFKKGKERELTITENIFYATGEWKVSAGNSKILNPLIQTLIQNPKFRLEIYSHTDATGNSQLNMDLSNKRAKAIVDLFVEKGIKSERLKGKGFGATKILNRCKEGVVCSEIENRVNRRTEFKLIKDE